MIKVALILALAVQVNAEGPPPAGAPAEAADRGSRPAAARAYSGSANQLTVPAPFRSDINIRIDGRLDDGAWADAPLLTGFTQFEPIEGAEASERTEVRVLVDEDALYFGIRAHDSSGGVRATLTERDGFGRSDDYVRVILDTFRDSRRAYVFSVNPLGVQGDGLWIEGRGGRGGPIDFNPDFLWESAGRLDDDGYTVEFRVPLKSLRFPDLERQDWGMQVTRSIRRTGYEESWAPVTTNQANLLSQSGTLQGLVGLDAGRVMEINPTMTGSRQGVWADDVQSLAHDGMTPDVGMNLTYGLTSNLTLDGTINPDFSQIEADAGQIQVNERFALRLSEKRPFFLEGTDIFSMPKQLVYTRSVVNPVGATKVSGKIGAFSVTYLGAIDEVGVDPDHPVVNLLRMKRDVGASSSVGMVYTDRTRPGTSFNRVAGTDARFVLGGRYTLELLAAGSADGRAGDATEYGSMLVARLNRSSRAFTFNASFEDVTDEFAARSGFINRTGITQLQARSGYTFRGRRGALVESIGASVDAESYWVREDFWAGSAPQEWETGVTLSTSLRGNIGAFLSWDRQSFDFGSEYYDNYFSGPEGSTPSPISTPDDLFSGLDALRLRSWISTWETLRISLGAGWNETAIFSGGVPMDLGESWSGDLGLTIVPSGSFQMEVGARHVRISRQRDGSRYSTATIPRFQSRYQFSRSLFVRGITEYSSQSRGAVLDPVNGQTVQRCLDGDCSPRSGSDRHDFRIEGLVGYEPSPGTVVYFGYTRQFEDLEAFRFQDLTSRADGLFIKLSYRFRM